METELDKVGDLKVVKKTPMGYILENGTEIQDTFAEMYHHNEIVTSVLGKTPIFSVINQHVKIERTWASSKEF